MTPKFHALYEGHETHEEKGGKELGEMKKESKADFLKMCDLPAGIKTPQSAFEMLYYCKCFG
jgi:hypothetical protein